MKKPFLFALNAGLYIVVLILGMNFVISYLKAKEDTIVIPMVMLSLFVLSAAVMGFLFLSEPLKLYLDGKKQEAATFFGKTVGIFACFVVVFLILLFII